MDSRKLFDGFQLLAMTLIAVGLAGQVHTITTPIFSVYLPASPFLFLLVVVLFGRYTPRFRGGVYGAELSAALILFVAYGWVYARTATYGGGGADIGVGLVMLSLPVVLIVVMAVGWQLGVASGK